MILTYHSVLHDPLPFPIWHHLSLEHFEHQIAYLAKHFRCVSMSELLDGHARGHIPPYTVSLTFDDGYRNNLTQVLPLLQRYNLPATLFITGGFVTTAQMLWPEWIACALAQTKLPTVNFAGQILDLRNTDARALAFRAATAGFRNISPSEIPARVDELLRATQLTRAQVENSAMRQAIAALNWDEVRQLHASGLFEFGAHTINHWHLTKLSHEQARAEIIGAKLLIEEQVGPVNYFAYPYGGPDDFDATHRALAIEAGYRAIFTASTQTVTPQSDVFELPRMGIGAHLSDEEFIYSLRGGIAAMAGRYWPTRLKRLFGG